MKRAVDEQLRIDLYNNRAREHCEWCGKWIALNEACPHHKKSRGSGGGNEPDNILICCLKCHSAIHSGTITKRMIDEREIYATQ